MAAYKSLVRPHLEYCSTVWDPPTKFLKNKLESVQGRSARWVFNKYRTGPNTTRQATLCELLDWPLLETRRRVARLCLLYKMANDLVLMSTLSLLVRYSYTTKAMPPHAFLPLDRAPSKLYFSSSFFPHTVTEWNALPHSVGCATSLEAFKT